MYAQRESDHRWLGSDSLFQETWGQKGQLTPFHLWKKQAMILKDYGRIFENENKRDMV